MSENKTRPTKGSVEAFIESVDDETKKADSYVLLELMKKITGHDPVLWGNSLIGFGNVRYKYKSGREGDWFLVGFSPRKQSLTLYIMPGFTQYQSLLDKLGKHKTGKGCLYVKRLSDIDMNVLTEIVTLSAEKTKTLWNNESE